MLNHELATRLFCPRLLIGWRLDGRAFLCFNGATNVSVAWAEIGWPDAARVRVRDLWLQQDLGTFSRGYGAAGALAPRDVIFLRLSVLGGEALELNFVSIFSDSFTELSSPAPRSR